MKIKSTASVTANAAATVSAFLGVRAAAANTMLRKLLMALVALIMPLSLLAEDFSATNSDGKTIYYRITSPTTVEVTYRGSDVNSYSNEYSGKVSIPSAVVYNGVTYSVTSIGNSAFSKCSALTRVTIPNSVTGIGNSAFYSCSGLTSVDIPESVTAIGKDAFYKCYSLDSVDIPESVTSIGSYAFYGCSGLTSVIIPNSVTSIGNSTFHYCSSLTSVSIPNSVTTIDEYAFYGCSGLTSVTIPNSVTSIGSYAFYDCVRIKSLTIEDGESLLTINPASFNEKNIENLYIGRDVSSWSALCLSENLKTVEIGNSVTSIGAYAFKGCSGLTSVTIPNSVTSIGGSAFYTCSGLTSLTIGNSVTTIGGYSFAGCTGLTSVNIPNSVTSIGEGAFSNCSGLSEVNIPNSVSTINNYAFYGCSSLTSLTIPSTITSIGDSAFYECSGIKTLTIEDGESILNLYSNNSSYYPFYGCKIENLYLGREVSSGSALCLSKSLKTLEIGNLITTIGDTAFYGYSSLTSVIIPESVTSIGRSAFYGCSGLTEVTIPNSVTSIGEYAFYDCTKLAEITISESITSIGDRTFAGCSGLTSVNIPNSVTSIGSSAFYGCSGLTSVTIPNSVTSIGESAFSGCSGLTSVNIPNSVAAIGNYVFQGCSGLTSVVIPNSVTSIGKYAFSGCSGLTSVVIPNSVTSIDKYAFSGCAGLTKVNIPNSVNAIGERAFSNCSGLKTLTIEDGESLLNLSNKYSSDYPFYGCEIENLYIGRDVSSWSALCLSENLKTVEIGNSVTSIGYAAFKGCSGLTEVNIPNSVTTIGSEAFSGCLGIKTLTIEDGESILNLSGNSSSYPFYGCKIENLYIGRDVSSWSALCLSENLKTVEIGNSVTAIGQSAFSGCSSLTEVTIGNSVTNIGASAFSNCTDLTSVTLPNSVTSIGNYAFKGCTALTEVTIPNSLVSIGTQTFLNCNGLTSIIIPESITYIGSEAFNGCRKLTVELLGGQCTVLSNAFSSIKTLIVGANVVATVNGNTPSKDIDKVIWLSTSEPQIKGFVTYVNSNSLGIKLDYLTSMFKVDGFTYVPLSPSERSCILIDCDYQSDVQDITIPESVIYHGIALNVVELGEYLMSRQDKISNLTISSPIKSIPASAFKDCINLSSFRTKYDNYLSIGSCAFLGCCELTEFYIPSTVTKIGASAFYDCNSLTQINIPNSVISIEQKAFFGCTGLYSATLGNSITSIGSSCFMNCSSLSEINIPNSVTSIGGNAFYGCSGLTSLTVGNSVTSIGLDAFSNCMALESINFNAINCKNNNNTIFDNCSNLSEFNIGEMVENLPSHLCKNFNINTLDIPSSVKSLGAYTFENCEIENLTLIDCEDLLSMSTNSIYNKNIKNVRIGRNIPECNIFFENSELKSVWITDLPTTVPEGMFRNCTGLEFVYVGDNVTSIGERAFSGCSSLKHFQYGKNLKSIGAEAFSDCTGITNIYAEPLTPPSVGTQALDDLDRWSCSIHVPAEALAAYQAAPQWKEFFFYDSVFPVTLNAESLELAPGQTFQLAATLTVDQPESRSAGDIRWVSTNPGVAVVDESGFVTATGNGKCSIAAFNADNVMANCLINIDEAFGDSLKGDVNSNGVVNLGDAVMVINHAIGIEQVGFDEAAADVDGNGTINLGDAVIIINYSIGTITEFPSKAPARVRTTASANLEIVAATADELTLTASIDSGMPFTALGMQLALPYGYEYVPGSLRLDGADGHMLAVNDAEPSLVRFAFASAANELVSADGRGVLTLKVRASEFADRSEAEFALEDIILVDPEGRCLYAADTACNLADYGGLSGFCWSTVAEPEIFVTGRTLHVMLPQDAPVYVFDLDGKYTLYQLHAGHNAIEMAISGYYIVTTLNKTKKIFVQ